MRRYAPSSTLSSFGPGAVTPIVKMLIWANVGTFVAMQIAPVLVQFFGLTPATVFGRLWL